MVLTEPDTEPDPATVPGAHKARRKLLLLHFEYPQISQTYIENERRELARRYETEVVCLSLPDIAAQVHAPFHVLKPPTIPEFVRTVQRINPDIVHGHFLHMAKILHMVAQIAGVPFTMRTHSADVFPPEERANPQSFVPFINDELCRGVLTFPPCRPLLEQAGIRPEKIVDTFPVVDFDRFHDRSPNGRAIMNIGAATPKKNMGDFIHLSRLMPEREFNLYALGYKVGELQQLNRELQGRVRFVPPVEPGLMLPEYKKHEWMVLTSARQMPYAGWPIGVAEAQAAGVGVCMQNIRPDLRDYVSDAGFIFDTVEDARRIVSQPFPAELRERGFENARRSDIRVTIGDLERLWWQ